MVIVTGVEMTVDLGNTLRHRLQETIFTLPIADRREGRDTLLAGIPQNGWSRVDENKVADISKIIEQLLHTHTGTLEQEETWGITIFIENAIRMAMGTTTAVQLQALREECLVCWRKAHLSHIVQMQSSSSTTVLSYQSADEILEVPQESHAALPIDTSTSSLFFQETSRLLQDMLEHIESAERLFCPPAKVADSRKRRHALKQLDDTFPLLTQLCECLEKTFPLPEPVAKQRYTLGGRLHYLEEQVKALYGWIDESTGAYHNICEHFERVKHVFQELSILQESVHHSSQAP